MNEPSPALKAELPDFERGVVEALREARRTLAKTATGNLTTNEVTIPLGFFESVIRNLDKALATFQSNEGEG